MSDSVIIKKLIEDRIRLEDDKRDLVEVLEMAENIIVRGENSNYVRSDVLSEIARVLVNVKR